MPSVWRIEAVNVESDHVIVDLFRLGRYPLSVCQHGDLMALGNQLAAMIAFVFRRFRVPLLPF